MTTIRLYSPALVILAWAGVNDAGCHGGAISLLALLGITLTTWLHLGALRERFVRRRWWPQ